MTAPSSGAAPELKPCPQEPGISAPPSQEEVELKAEYLKNFLENAFEIQDMNHQLDALEIVMTEVRRLRTFEIQLGAWHSVFGTQLSHAVARLEKAESDAVRLRALVEAQTEYIKFLEGAASEADLWEEDLEKMRSLRERISSLTNPGATGCSRMRFSANKGLGS